MARVVGTWLDKHEDDIKKGKKKLLFLMRHAESEFNERRRDSFRRLRVRDMFSYDPNMQDVCLTDRGLQQCASAARFYSQFRAELPTVEVDAYIVSPLSRTIQTALNTFSCPAVSRDPEHRLSPRPREGELPENQAVEPLHTHEKWLLLPLVRERTDTTGDTGRKAEELRDHLEALRASRRLPPNCSIDEDLDWSLVNPLNKWWLQFADDEIAQIEEVLSAPWYDADARKHHHLNGEEHAQETLRPSGSSHGPASSVAGEQAAAQQLNKLESDGEETPLETEPESVRDQLKAALRDYSTDVHDLIREQAWAERLQASWRFRKVPLESSRAVRARMRLVLKAICSVKDARVVVIVGHSIAFRVLTSTPKMGNASMAPFALDCESKTITDLH
ncbi:conserved hypothetical protein [Neospora caninum Liverpool]|uniref:Phosphoglycerate mutase domain-containing protein n=1 Tax=Neospora caninum (strain Liverpool) TaxID=572307 RepID=F0V9Q8_NEOCL|nr:conserved hypothetical protein [Neospora caninum Liverpool]CBZ50219.1 conserved hypothetical protein [Neospora caninum Liverpool]CEL64820.1 TPA: Phosphoglycerate mutase domain-containing protein [Neospora caninum Liverpool]|eukprot:XP_003880254.1 conserved hypothetical protein [Neospora caninum Liverpool]